MAESTFEKRRRERERQEEEARQEREDLERNASKLGESALTRAMAGDGSLDKLLELFQRAGPMIEQLNSLYNQYLAGIQQLPPIEQRKQLDQIMLTLQGIAKPTAAYQFRFTTLNASYITHRDRWDRMLKDLESGKLKRTAGPRRGS